MGRGVCLVDSMGKERKEGREEGREKEGMMSSEVGCFGIFPLKGLKKTVTAMNPVEIDKSLSISFK